MGDQYKWGEGQIYLTWEGKVSISGLASRNTKLITTEEKHHLQSDTTSQFHATKTGKQYILSVVLLCCFSHSKT